VSKRKALLPALQGLVTHAQWRRCPQCGRTDPHMLCRIVDPPSSDPTPPSASPRPDDKETNR